MTSCKEQFISAKKCRNCFFTVIGRTSHDADVKILNPRDVFHDDQPIKSFIEVSISSKLTHGIDVTLAANFCGFVWKGSAP